jgi:hypothetical protein
MSKYVNYAFLVMLVLALAGGPALGKEASLTRAEIKDGWILLFDGESMFGLSQEGAATWRIADGSLLADGSGAGYLRTTSAFSDFVLKMDVRMPSAGADAAVYVRTGKDSVPTDNGYQIRIGDGNPNWPAGSIVPRSKASPAHLQAGQWYALEVDAEGDRLTVMIDQKTVAQAKDASARSGYIGFKVGPGAALEVRNLKLKLLNTVALFNGSDLTGWKTVTPPPRTEKPSKLKKLIPFAGGGKPNVKESAWSVKSGTIHGEKGPGQLETVSAYDDFVLQFTVPASPRKHEGHHTIYLRGDAGKVFTGYEIVLDADRPGAIAPKLAAPRKFVSVAELAVGTVAVSGRHLEVWVNGFPTTEFTDTRPEGASTAQNARTSTGAIALPLHDSSASADYTEVRLTTVTRPLGGIMGKPLPSPTPAVANVQPGGVPVVPLSPEARQEAENRKQSARLMEAALATKNLEEQKNLYRRVVELDPNNAAAVQGYKEAQEKLEKRAEEAQRQANLQIQTQQNESTSQAALQKAETAFVLGNLPAAESQLALAERLAPNSPAVRELRQKLDAVRAQNQRIRYLLFGGGFLAVGGLSSLGFIRFRKKHGFIQVVSGMDNGRRYNLDREVVRIGAVAEDNGEKNDIIVRDVEHMVSRFHCEIHQDKGKFYLMDCNSANGTRIDKRPVLPEQFTRLKNGSRIELASSTTLLFGLERRRKNGSSDRQYTRQMSSG